MGEGVPPAAIEGVPLSEVEEVGVARAGLPVPPLPLALPRLLPLIAAVALRAVEPVVSGDAEAPALAVAFPVAVAPRARDALGADDGERSAVGVAVALAERTAVDEGALGVAVAARGEAVAPPGTEGLTSGVAESQAPALGVAPCASDSVGAREGLG